MIYGVGTDICVLARVEKVLAKDAGRFTARLLTPTEQKYEAKRLDNPAVIAKYWAAKEALSKALGVGIGAQLSFQDICIGRTATGQPTVAVANEAFAGINYHLSLSDDGGYVVAFVVAEKA